jgi:hypothetical protein
MHGLSRWEEKEVQVGSKLTAGVRRNVYETETESEDEVIDLNEEVDEDIVITREVTRKQARDEAEIKPEVCSICGRA